MKTMEIRLSDLEQILKLVKYEQSLVVKLSAYLEYQKIGLKQLESIKGIAKFLVNFRSNKKWWAQVDPEIKKVILKYGRF